MPLVQISSRRLRGLGVAIALAAVGGCSAGEAARVATAMTAHVMCSQTFVVGRDPEWIFRSFLAQAPGIDAVAPFLRYNIDIGHKSVTATLAGGFLEEARFAEGRGCTIGAAQDALPQRRDVVAADPLKAPEGVVTSDNPAITEALDRAWDEPRSGPKQNVAAIVIVHDGRIIAERYAANFTPETSLHGWSVSKSATQALFGVLVQQGRIAVSQPAPLALWQSLGDPRGAVTIDMLLRHIAGLPFGAENSGFDRASQMLFLARDTFEISAAPPFDPQGAQWRYSDANYQILSGILRDQLGAPASFAAFAQRELFAPLGMRNVVMEFDAAGTPLGSAFFYASARDWARLGWLYANDGVVGDRRILPEGWVEYSRTPTPQAQWGYGAGFWTNMGESDGARRRRGFGAPDNSFFANGNFGQTILIAPKEQLVIVRFGFSLENGGVNLQRTMRLAGEVAAALQ